jgi:membrane-bound serine protease (ClpP class)
MALLVAILLAVFLLPSPWNVIVVVGAAIWELATVVVGIWYSRRRRPQAGVETLVGEEARVVTRCAPSGQVKLSGEIWDARCEQGAEIGETVRVRAVEQLTLIVDRA